MCLDYVRIIYKKLFKVLSSYQQLVIQEEKLLEHTGKLSKQQDTFIKNFLCESCWPFFSSKEDT